jgi:hypothetical protein
MESSTYDNPTGLHGLLVDSFTFLYVDDVCTSQEIYLWASTAHYGYIFTSLNVDSVHTSQETRSCASMAYYGLVGCGVISAAGPHDG